MGIGIGEFYGSSAEGAVLVSAQIVTFVFYVFFKGLF